MLPVDGSRGDLIFVGGSGRSGTTVVGQMLGAHRDWTAVPIELRFHVDREGLCDVLTGLSSLPRFRDRMLTVFYKRESEVGVRGLYSYIRYEDIEAALDRFVERFAVDRYAAGRELLVSILSLGFGRDRGWLETTPGNVVRWELLSRMLPDAKLVHAVRDGRDVAASVARMKWGPNNIVDGLYWWDGRLREADKARRVAKSGSVFVLPFDALFSDDRDSWVDQLLMFAEIERTPEVDSFLETVTRSEAHVGRWRRGLTESECEEVQALYDSLLDGLRVDEVVSLPWQGSD